MQGHNIMLCLIMSYTVGEHQGLPPMGLHGEIVYEHIISMI